MVHSAATLTSKDRTLLARCILHEHWPVRRAAERFRLTVFTATRWAKRFQEEG